MKFIKVRNDTIINLDKIAFIQVDSGNRVTFWLDGEQGGIKVDSARVKEYLLKLATDLTEK